MKKGTSNALNDTTKKHTLIHFWKKITSVFKDIKLFAMAVPYTNNNISHQINITFANPLLQTT